MSNDENNQYGTQVKCGLLGGGWQYVIINGNPCKIKNLSLEKFEIPLTDIYKIHVTGIDIFTEKSYDVLMGTSDIIYTLDSHIIKRSYKVINVEANKDLTGTVKVLYEDLKITKDLSLPHLCGSDYDLAKIIINNFNVIQEGADYTLYVTTLSAMNKEYIKDCQIFKN